MAESLTDRFFDRLASGAWDVLEVGTRGWDGREPRHHKARVMGNPANRWTGCDALPGPGVDVVADLCELSRHFPAGRFGAAVVPAVLEHVARPWEAAAELAKVVRPGGLLFVSTHHTFPHHEYPRDYFRFTADGLRALFGAWSGWRVLSAEHEFPCKVVPMGNLWPHADGWNFEADAWLNVTCLAERL